MMPSVSEVRLHTLSMAMLLSVPGRATALVADWSGKVAYNSKVHSAEDLKFSKSLGVFATTTIRWPQMALIGHLKSFQARALSCTYITVLNCSSSSIVKRITNEMNSVDVSLHLGISLP